MNDRASAAPPPHFLGPDPRSPSSASLPNFAPHSSSSSASSSQGDHETQPRRPRSASISEKKGLSGLWEGLREKIWGKKRPVSFDSGAVQRPEAALAGAGGGGENRPTREQMLASYQELMAQGFFQARAIQGTRQPLPGSRAASRGEFGQAYVRPKLETIYSPRRGPPDSEVDLPIQGTPDPSADPSTPDSRGKKRAHDDDGEKTEEKGVRKLRKTTRSITELHSRLRRARDESHPPVSYRANESGSGVRARRSVSGSGPNRLVKRPVRLPSPGENRETSSAPVTVPVRVSPGPCDAGTGFGGGSLRLRRVPADESLRERMDVEPRPQTPTQSANWVRLGPPDEAAPRTPQSPNWISCEGEDPDVQSDNWVSAERSPRARSPPGRGPRRTRSPRKMPLSVVPDANKGIPNVPAIPEHFKTGHGENGRVQA